VIPLIKYFNYPIRILIKWPPRGHKKKGGSPQQPKLHLSTLHYKSFLYLKQGGPEIDGVYVKQVQRDSAADQDGRIKKGISLLWRLVTLTIWFIKIINIKIMYYIPKFQYFSLPDTIMYTCVLLRFKEDSSKFSGTSGWRNSRNFIAF